MTRAIALAAVLAGCWKTDAQLAAGHLGGNAICSLVSGTMAIECIAQGRYFTCLVAREQHVECAEIRRLRSRVEDIDPTPPVIP